MKELYSAINQSSPWNLDSMRWAQTHFKAVGGNKNTVRDYGQVLDDGEADVNWSSILTKLIKLAAKNCEHYASDLFYDWQSITELLASKKLKENGVAVFLFGFRDMGVDGNTFVKAKFNNADTYAHDGKLYNEIWRLTISTECLEVAMTLEKVKFEG